MVEDSPEDPSLKSLEGLANYIDVLVESYPEPISRKELAEKVGVSKAAVTKVNDRLLSLCNFNTLVFGHKLILRTDCVSTKLLVLYVTKLRPARILKSRYGLAVLRKIGIHAKVCEVIPNYGLYFDEYDTETMVKIFLHNMDNLRIEDKIKATIEGIQNEAISMSLNYIEAFGVLLNQFDLPIKNPDDLIGILRIRDKGFILAKDLIVNQIKKASILSQLPESEKEKYLEVYTGTIDYYLKKVLSTFTGLIENVAKKNTVEFKEDYRKIGYFTQRIKP